MGVQGLWSLLSPAGRRIKIETLEGKVLAIDVSIWLLKMIHGYLALGNEEYRNIHLIGIFRRIVKLLYYGIKPVFVFDGKFPELKRETVRRRQEVREKRKVNLKKVAEKFLSKVLEDRLKETVGRVLQPKRPVENSSQQEDLWNEEEQEEEKVFNDDVQVFDYEFDYIVDENKELLLEAGIDLEEFYLRDTETQYNTIKKVKNKLRDRKIKKYLDIESLDDLSKVHIKDYVGHIQRKHQIEKSKEKAYSKKLDQEHELIIGNNKFKDIMQSNYIRSFFIDPKKDVVQGTLASDRTKKFMYLTQKNEAYDTQVLKVEKKRGSKNERLKKLSAQLRDIAQHAENAPQLFSFEELLCDNPLEAFKHSNMKEDEANIKSSLGRLSIEQDSGKKANEDSQNKVDVDEAFGFDEWENNEDTQANLEESKKSEEEKKDDKKEEESNSDLDLFEFSMDEMNDVTPNNTEETASQVQDTAKNEVDIKVKENESETETSRTGKEVKKDVLEVKNSSLEKRSKQQEEEAELEDLFYTANSDIEVQEKTIIDNENVEEKKDKTDKNDYKTKEVTKNEEGFKITVLAPEENDEPQRKKVSFFGKKSSSQVSESNTSSAEKKETLFQRLTQSPPKRNKIDTEFVSMTQPQELSQEERPRRPETDKFSVPKFEESPPKKSVAAKKTEKSDVSWYQRLINQDLEKSKNILKEREETEAKERGESPPKEMEISMFKETQEFSNDRNSQEMSQKIQKEVMMTEKTNNSMGDFPENMDFGDLDEDKLMFEMKELESTENMDKWQLMQEFQKFQNLSEFEAGSIQEKFQEIKELLILFGIPWVDSPTEAEAQCSFLEENGLIDGVITDDSDAFLFGGRNIYRNIFDKGDFAHLYKMSYVESDMALDRTKLILLALFLGSDYTLGIRGVGIVNAIEIVTAFDSAEGLRRFKEWAEVPDVLLENASEHYKNVPQKELEYKLYHRNFKKHWELPEEFPDDRVIDAYWNPQVDKSLEKFEWGNPDFASLTKYCETKFNWDETRIFNLLEPLKKAIREKGNQSKITDFFREEKIAVVNSKRIKEAITHLKRSDTDERDAPATITKSIENIIEKQNPSNIKKRKTGDYANELIKQFAFDKKRVKKNN